jgi:hypothetical protein
MARIEGVTRPGIIARLAFFFTRRKVGRVVRPMRIFALNTPCLLGFGQMELALDRARRVPLGLKRLVQIRVATMIGCPF